MPESREAILATKQTFGGKMLTQTGVYALRAMSHLAMQESSRFISSRDLAEGSNVPPFYLSKVMRKLVNAGLVRSRKGHAGGFAFARSHEEVTFLDVLEAVNPEEERAECFFGHDTCDPKNPCLLHFFWMDLQGGFKDWARHTNFSDVQRINEKLQFFQGMIARKKQE